jgi:protein FAM32A
MARKVAKLAKQTHKDRVHEFNEKLESLSEHHDIPKVCAFDSLETAH